MYTIEDLREGKVACLNDGTIELLRDVLKVAFPEYQIIPMGYNTYYLRSVWGDAEWGSYDATNLPTQSVKDFQLKKVKEIVREKLDLKEALEKYPFIGVDEHFEGRDSYIRGGSSFDYNFIKSWIDGGKTKYYFFETEEMLNRWVKGEI